MHDALDPCIQGRTHHVDRALHVDPKHLDGFREPVVENRAQMIDGVATLDRAREGRGVPQVSFDHLDVEPVEVLRSDTWFDERPDDDALFEENADEVGADETRGARYQRQPRLM